MTPQERELLESLANRIANTPVPEKDREAEDLIRQRVGSNPNALYILTQSVLIQDIALQQAKAQIQELQQRVASSHESASSREGQHTSFLGKLFGGGAEPPHASSAPAAPAQTGGQQFGAQNYQPAAPQGGGGMGSSFLRSAATTAAGVAAGALAFEGIQSLLGHHGGIGQGLMGGGFGDSGLMHSPGNEYVTNNYYDAQTSNARDDTASDDSTQDDTDTATDADSDTSADDSSDFGGNDDTSV